MTVAVQQIQRDLKDAIVNRLLQDDFPATVAQTLVHPDRVHVHQNHFYHSLTKALTSLYSACVAMVGETFFEALCQAFIPQHPPQKPSLYAYGGDFPTFLRGFEPAQQVPFLADLAALEWALNVSFHAHATAPLTLAHMAAVPQDQWEETHLSLQPTVQLVTSPYPVDALWRFSQPGADQTAAPALDSGPVYLLVQRQDYDTGLASITASDYAFLKALAQDKTLGDAVDAACDVSETFDFMATFSRLVEAGVFRINT